jgi:hypothetical protein
MLKWTDVSEVRTATIIITLMMAAVRNSGTPVHFNVTTWRYIPENCTLSSVFLV